MSYMKTVRRKKDIGINVWMAKWYDKNIRESFEELILRVEGNKWNIF